MIIKIDFESEVPIYVQIKDQIVEGIASGSFAEGETLPSVRQFAKDIGVNMHTINKAYTLLKNDGFVVVHKRKGVVINKLSQMSKPDFLKEIPNIIKPLIAEAYCRGIKEKDFIEGCKKIYLAFNKG